MATTHLFQYQHFAEAWDQVLKPQLQAATSRLGDGGLPTLLLAPDSATIAVVKRWCVAYAVPLAGVTFTVPGRLRSQWLKHCDPSARLALREDLHLIVAQAAATMPEVPLARSVLLDPSQFASWFDQLDVAGWSAEAFSHTDARELGKRVQDGLKSAGLITAAEADRRLLAHGKRLGQRYRDSLAVGFHAQQLAALNALRWLPSVCGQVSFCVPTQFESPLRQQWLETLEALVDNSQSLAGLASSENASEIASAQALADAFEAAVPFDATAAKPHCAVFTAKTHEAVWCVDRAMEMASGATLPVAIVFSDEADPLSRSVANRLCELRIPHFDDMGILPTPTPAQALLGDWVAYQRTRDLDHFLAFMTQLIRQQPTRVNVTASEIETACKAAFLLTRTTSMAVLLPAVIAANADMAPMLNLWPLLPEQLNFADFMSCVSPVCEGFGWPQSPDLLKHRADVFSVAAPGDLPLVACLDWLEAVTRVPGKTRAALGRQPFGGIYLMSLAKAALLPWSGVVLSGMLSNSWPPRQRHSLLVDTKQVANLNRKAQVSRGQGSWRAPHSAMLSPADLSREFEYSLRELLRNSGGNLGASLTLGTDSSIDSAPAPAMAWHRLYHLAHGATLTLDAVAHMAAQAEATYSVNMTHHANHEPADVAALATKWLQRRDRRRPFGPETYCLDAAPEGGLKLSARKWELALMRPMQAWFEAVLKVEPKPLYRERDVDAMSFGVWLHQWLHYEAASESFQKRLDGDSWRSRVQQRAMATRQHALEAYRSANRELPDWWQIEWARCHSAAMGFVNALGHITDFPYWLSEYELPDAMAIPLDATNSLRLSGRVDLVLSEMAQWDAGQGALWVLDYKTGSSAKLSVTELVKGRAVQLLLYAKALDCLRGQGHEGITMSLLKPGDAAEPGLTIGELLDELEPVWAALRDRLRMGRFGLGDEDYAYKRETQRPLATLPISKSIARDRAVVTQKGCDNV